MRTINLNIKFELPDRYQDWERENLLQLFSDEIINHSICSHLEFAMQSLVSKADAETDQNKSEWEIIHEEHKLWAKTLKSAV